MYILEAAKALTVDRENDCSNRACGSYTPQQKQRSMYVQSCFLQSPKSSISVTEQQNPAYETMSTNTGTACSAGHTYRNHFVGGEEGEERGCTPVLVCLGF